MNDSMYSVSDAKRLVADDFDAACVSARYVLGSHLSLDDELIQLVCPPANEPKSDELVPVSFRIPKKYALLLRVLSKRAGISQNAVAVELLGASFNRIVHLLDDTGHVDELVRLWVDLCVEGEAA